MNFKKMTVSFFIAAVALSMPTLADEVSVKKGLFDKFKKLPPVLSVKKTALKDLYEVNIFGRAAYTNENADFLLMGGSLVNLGSLEDETAKRQPYLLSEFVSNLPYDLAIKTVYGNGENKFITFEDPDCPYCKRLTQTFQANKEKLNATVYTFQYPLSIHKDAPNKSKFIMCQKNPSETWASWMGSDKGLPVTQSADGLLLDPNSQKECTLGINAVETGAKIARTLGFNSSPRILMPSGAMEKGDVKIDRVIEMMKESRAAMENLQALKSSTPASPLDKKEPRKSQSKK